MATRSTSPTPSAVRLKAPVWTWEVPTYFFVGGLSGIAAVIAAIASGAGADDAIVRAARFLSVGGAAISPLLLISDLGRPARFLYMLRVFKVQSAMSVGVWTLVAFSGASVAAFALWALGPSNGVPLAMRFVADFVAAGTGLVLATYTGVLLGATVLPVWASRHRSLPLEFGMSSLGAAASAIECLAGTTPSLARAAMAAALVETVLWVIARVGTRSAPNRMTGRAAALAGPAALAFRLASFVWPGAWIGAALAALSGSALLRFGWIEAGRADAASMRQ